MKSTVLQKSVKTLACVVNVGALVVWTSSELSPVKVWLIKLSSKSALSDANENNKLGQFDSSNFHLQPTKIET